MRPTRLERRRVPALAPALAALACLAPATVAAAADAPPAKHGAPQRLVVRGDATVVDRPCSAHHCHFAYAGGAFRGTLGSGAYSGGFDFDPADVFPNGEGGVCAPIRGRIVLGVGSPDRLVLALRGHSCQDGAHDPTTSAFTTVARFTVERGAGRYADARGTGILASAEDAADHDRLTLIGRRLVANVPGRP
jgi:hypothetical protein